MSLISVEIKAYNDLAGYILVFKLCHCDNTIFFMLFLLEEINFLKILISLNNAPYSVLSCIATLYFNTPVRCLSVRTLLRETDQNAVTYSLFFISKVKID